MIQPSTEYCVAIKTLEECLASLNDIPHITLNEQAGCKAVCISMQCCVLDWILDEEKDLCGKTHHSQIKSRVQLLTGSQC